jgi:hypothetical protein
MAKIGNFEDHHFVGQNPRYDRPIQPNEICGVEMRTATKAVEGYDMWAQCGHTLSEHPRGALHGRAQADAQNG